MERVGEEEGEEHGEEEVVFPKRGGEVKVKWQGPP